MNRSITIMLLVLALMFQLGGLVQGQQEEPAEPSSTIITPENNFAEWESGKDIVIPPVQRGNTIFRPKVTIEWEKPVPTEPIGIENFIQPWGDIVIKPIEHEGTLLKPKSASIEWENIPILPKPLPKASEPVVVPVENVRPPDLIIPQENFENLSPYQQYVTPNAPAIRDLARQTHSVEGAYWRAVNWVWVSDRTLHGAEEKWLYPQQFLADTPTYPTNPVLGGAASDCESQAYTLVSVLRAMGMPPENVRVAVGKVQFGEQVGGHAWAEIFVCDRWLALEATSGPYWDDDKHILIERNGTPYDYFGSYEYPSLEVWAYFNDKYFYNTSTGEGNAPPHWWTAGPPSRFDWLSMTLLLVMFAALAVLVAEIALLMRKGKHKVRKLRTQTSIS